MNKKTILIISLVSLNLLTSCTNTANKLETNSEDTVQTEEKYMTSNIQQKTITKIDEWDKELTIDERCIWCGKCAMIAPTNFAMDYNTLKAVVISQKNMFSQEVSTSLQVCPTDSIHII